METSRRYAGSEKVLGGAAEAMPGAYEINEKHTSLSSSRGGRRQSREAVHVAGPSAHTGCSDYLVFHLLNFRSMAFPHNDEIVLS